MAADSEVKRIVQISRERNAAMQVTGALLFTGVRFAQCIEGPERAVAVIRETIMRDERHHTVTTLLDEAVTSRQFEHWSLAHAGASASVSTRINRAVREVRERSGPGGAHLRNLLRELIS